MWQRGTQGRVSSGWCDCGGVEQRAHLAHELPCLLPRRAGGEEGTFEGIGRARRALGRRRFGEALHEGLATARRHTSCLRCCRTSWLCALYFLPCVWGGPVRGALSIVLVRAKWFEGAKG